MSNSEEQFQELIAQLVVRANKMLSEHSEMLPIGLLLMSDNRIDVSVIKYEATDQIPSLVEAMRLSISEKATICDAVASCIAYQDYAAGQIVASLENRENYCATVKLPIDGAPLKVEFSKISVEEGYIYVFPIED